MKPSTTTVILLAITASFFLPPAQGHTYLTQPMAEFKPGASKVWWVAEFSPPWPGTFLTGADYVRAASLQGYRTIRTFLETKGPACGNSLSNAQAKAVPTDGLVKIARAMEDPGPCEIWIDDERVYDREDCKKVLGPVTAFKVDFSSCKGSCVLRFYWLGMGDGGKRWHAYKNCVPLKKESRSLDDDGKGEGEAYSFSDLEKASNDTYHRQ